MNKDEIVAYLESPEVQVRALPPRAPSASQRALARHGEGNRAQ